MSGRRRLIVNPTLQLAALADISRRGKGRRRIEVTDARALRLLLAAATGGRRPRLDRGLARRLLREGILVRPAEVPDEVDWIRASPAALSGRLPPLVGRGCVLAFASIAALGYLTRSPSRGASSPFFPRRASCGCATPEAECSCPTPSRRRWNGWSGSYSAAIGTPGREPLLVFLGVQLAAVVRQVTRERAPSTFSFLRIYDGGTVLTPHRDQPVCRWNVDLVVGGEPAPERRTAWPLGLAARPGRRAVRLGLGDGVLYRGTHLTHWRSAQPAGHSTVLACFHYGRASSRA